MPAPMLLDECRPADKRPLRQIHQTREAELEGRVLLRLDHRLLAAVEIDVDEEQSRFDAGDIEREHPGWVEIELRAGGDERIPHREGAGRRQPDLVTQIARVSRTRNINEHVGDRCAGGTKVLQRLDRHVGDGPQQLRRRRSLQRQCGDLFGIVFDLDVQP